MAGLSRHRRVHTDQNVIHCPHCEEKFGRRDNLNRHIKKKHPPLPAAEETRAQPSTEATLVSHPQGSSATLAVNPSVSPGANPGANHVANHGAMPGLQTVTRKRKHDGMSLL